MSGEYITHPKTKKISPRISKNKSENLYKLFITCENDKKISIETNLKIKNFSHAKKIISNIHSFLERLDKKTEKIYLLEHILLRQDNFEENDLYKFNYLSH